MNRTILLGAALLAAPAALAQQHGGMDHGQMDHSRAGDGATHGMDHGAMDPDAVMALHARMMADPEIHAAMMADPETRALMSETLPMDHSGMDHSQMAGMDHGQRQGMDHSGMTAPMDADAQAAAMAQMRERMAAMPPAQRADVVARMQAAHARLMADPETRRAMETIPGMDHSQMDHGSMQGVDHSQMDHSGTASGTMSGLDHGQVAGKDHSAGVALQRRNAGAVRNDDERPATPTVGPEAFAASETADRFHAALAAGDRMAVEAILAPDAVVLSAGRHYARAEYLGGPFVRDARALVGGAPEPLYRRTGVAGDAAWVASTQRVGGAERAELLVMKWTPEGWRVAAVHWSSAR